MYKKSFKSLVLVLLVFTLIVPTFADTQNEEVKEEIDEVDKIEKVMDYILKTHQSSVLEGELSKDDLIEGAYKGMFKKLDEHSNFYNEQEYKNFQKTTSGEYGGIGAVITMGKESIEIITPLDDAPAIKAGLKAKDVILEVDSENIQDLTLEEAVNKITGKPGTKVKLKIKRNTETFEKTLTRELIHLENVEYELKENNIGYLKIKRFQNETYEEVFEAIMDLKVKGAKKLIIDLRNNPGGYLTDALKVSDIFIDPKKPIMHVDYKEAKDKSFYTEKDDLFKGTITVLINNGSASASEILASAIEENNEGVLIGESTYGKGTVQTVQKIDDKKAIKLTVAEYLTGKKAKINNIGVKPTIEVKKENKSLTQKDLDKLAPMTENRKISYKESSVNVYGAQQRLNLLGYDLKEDGLFGPNTLKAIKDFQRKNNLQVANFINYKFKNKLNSVLNEKVDSPEDTILLKATNYLLNN